MSFLHIDHNRPLVLRHGFTIVELLIVIVVIGILTAVTIVAFNGLNDRANQSAVRSGVKETAKRIELDKVTRGSYAANLNELTNSTKSEDGVPINTHPVVKVSALPEHSESTLLMYQHRHQYPLREYAQGMMRR